MQSEWSCKKRVRTLDPATDLTLAGIRTVCLRAALGNSGIWLYGWSILNSTLTENAHSVDVKPGLE